MEKEIKSPLFDKCGGCAYNGDYPKQLIAKQKNVEKLLGIYGKIQPIVGMAEPYFYRNKVHHVLSQAKNGTITDGFYEANSHRLVCPEKCLLEDEVSQSIIKTVCKLIRSFRLTVYNEDSGKGLFRHILIRRGYKTGQIMVVFVLTSLIFPSKNNFIRVLREEHPEITAAAMNVNNRKTSAVLGERTVTLFGDRFIRDSLCGKVFRISPTSFYQVNPIQTEKLYEIAIRFAELKKTDTVIDAYSGIGTIGLAASDACEKVIGVELNEEAVKDAEKNAKENKVKNAFFYCDDAGKFMVDMANAGEKANVVFMDPPRSGSTETFMRSVVALAPERVVYISCNPVTLARDLVFFVREGYKVARTQPVDMFPHTEHVETVVLLEKR